MDLLQKQDNTCFLYEKSTELSCSDKSKYATIFDTDNEEESKIALTDKTYCLSDHAYCLSYDDAAFSSNLNVLIQKLNVASSDFPTAVFLPMRTNPVISDILESVSSSTDMNGKLAICKPSTTETATQLPIINTPLKTFATFASVTKVQFNHPAKVCITDNYESSRFGYQCSYCDKLFGSKFSASRHQKSHTMNPDQFTCFNCDKCFSAESSLLRHTNLVHLKIKNHECPICQKKFGLKHNLDNHMRSHSNERPFSCEFCDKCFKSAGNLHLHMVTHSDNRQYQCDFCDKSYKRRDKLNRHYQRHLNVMYKCRICAASFESRQLRRDHVKEEHVKYKPCCKLCKKTFAAVPDLKQHVCSILNSQKQKGFDNESASDSDGNLRTQRRVSDRCSTRCSTAESNTSEQSDAEENTHSRMSRQLAKIRRRAEKGHVFVSSSGSDDEADYSITS